MFRSYILAAALIAGTVTASANELDNEGQVTNQALQGTVVIRVDQRDGSVAMLQADAMPASQDEAQALLGNEFTKVPAANLRTELDRDGGASSWYWCYNPYTYASTSLYWYGYNYNPYYSYNYSSYNYYYYSSYNYGYGGYYGNYGGYYGYGYGGRWGW